MDTGWNNIREKKRKIKNKIENNSEPIQTDEIPELDTCTLTTAVVRPCTLKNQILQKNI